MFGEVVEMFVFFFMVDWDVWIVEGVFKGMLVDLGVVVVVVMVFSGNED